MGCGLALGPRSSSRAEQRQQPPTCMTIGSCPVQPRTKVRAKSEHELPVLERKRGSVLDEEHGRGGAVGRPGRVRAACARKQVSNNDCRVSLSETRSPLYPFHHHLLNSPPPPSLISSSLQHFTGQLICSRVTSPHE